MREVATGQDRVYVIDGQYNVIGVADNQGQLPEAYRYNTYGTPVVLVGGAATQPYGFQGKRYGTYTGALRTLHMYDFRARAYDPLLGKLLQRDPAEYADGPDLYEAFRSNPLVYLDPSGTFSLLELDLTSAFAMDLEGSKGEAYTSLLTSVRGMVGLANSRNQLLADLTGSPARSVDTSAIDFTLSVWNTYQHAQAALFLDGVLNAGAKFATNGIFALRMGRGHHGIPKFMGGKDKQWLYHGKKYEKYHQSFHGALRDAMRRAQPPFPPENVGARSFRNYLKRSGRQKELLNLLQDVAQGFDAKHGTTFFEAFWTDYLSGLYKKWWTCGCSLE